MLAILADIDNTIYFVISIYADTLLKNVIRYFIAIEYRISLNFVFCIEFFISINFFTQLKYNQKKK